MPETYSFDVVSDFDRQELVNAVDQLRREINQRYDLKDSKSDISLEENEIIITTDSEMTLRSIEDILLKKASKRNLSVKIFDFQKAETSSGNRVLQRVNLKKGLSKELAKELTKLIRDQIKKVNVSIQGESIRVVGKNKDDLQSSISLLREKEGEIDIPLQFENYR